MTGGQDNQPASETAARRRIMEQRARRLAAPLAPPDAGAAIPVVLFRIGNELYGLDPGFVAQVARIGPLTQVPGARPPFAGLLNLRGEIMTVFSLSAAMGRPQRPVAESSRAIVCGGEGTRFALIADEVLEATSVRAGDLAPPPKTAALAGCIRGIAPSGIIVLDGGVLAAASGPLFTGAGSAPANS